MKKQLVLTRSGFSGILLGVLTLGLAAGYAAQNGQRDPAAPAAPCGPNIAGELGTNTAKNSRCFELRMYTVDTSKSRINDLHKRFRDGEVEIFKKNGMEVLGVWQSLDDPNTLVYLLAHKDRAARDASWAAFQADPRWIELRTKYPVTLTPKIFMMSAANYSPLK
jgi:NIPSNAP